MVRFIVLVCFNCTKYVCFLTIFDTVISCTLIIFIPSLVLNPILLSLFLNSLQSILVSLKKFRFYLFEKIL